MPLWLIGLLLAAYLAAPLIELRLWRSGLLSDRLVTGLLLARMPVLLAALALWSGHVPDPFLVAGFVLIAALGYRWQLPEVRQRGEELRSRQA